MRKLLGLMGLLMLLGVCGCSAMGHLYPVTGPLSQGGVSSGYVAKFTVKGRTNISMLVLLGNGERAEGPMVFLQGGNAAKGVTPIAPLSAQWDAVYGQGSYVAKVLGQGQDARGTLTGTAGTVLRVEVHAPYPTNNRSASDPLTGVAEDNRGNVYKVAF